MKKLILILSSSVVLLNACKKADFADKTPTGEGLVDFTLITPASGNKLALNAATPNATVSFSWNAARPGLITNPSYTIVAALRTGGDLHTPLVSFDAGTVTSMALTQKQLDDALKAKSIGDGVATDLIWSVKATNGDVTILSSSVFFITITRMKDGATPFLLLGPSSSLLPTTINPTSTTDFVKFNWTKSKPATGGPAITYKIMFAERKLDANGNEIPVDWNAPLFSINSDNNGADSLATISYKRLSDSLTVKGFTNLPAPVMLKWTAVATSGTWKQQSDYVNNIVIVREVKIYIVGSATPNGWDASQAIRMIPDESTFGVYYMYVYLTAGEMKFLNGQAFPPAPGALDWGQNPSLPAGNLAVDGEVNIPVPSAGVYRVTFDMNNLKFYLQTGRMATVGGATLAGWDPPSVFPTQALSYIGVNRFIGILPFKGGDEFKMIDNNAWPSGGGPVSQSRDYGKGATDGILKEAGESNIPGPALGNSRIIWDGSNPLDLKYSLTPATEMRVVGDGITGGPVWDPPTSPQMTYSGNGVWTIVINLTAGKEIKFLAGNAWGALDYEDNSGGSTATGTPRSIKWDGSDNFKTPAVSGSYTITLNENTQTVTIN